MTTAYVLAGTIPRTFLFPLLISCLYCGTSSGRSNKYHIRIPNQVFHFSIAVYSMLSHSVNNQVTVLTCTADGAMSMEWELRAELSGKTLTINYDSIRDSTLNQITNECINLSSTITPSSAYENLYNIQSTLEVSSSFSEGSGVFVRCFGGGQNDHFRTNFQRTVSINFFNRPTECKLLYYYFSYTC